MEPSTDWREVVDRDEAERHARLAEEVRHWHGVKNRRWGKGRFLHRKLLLGAGATLTVHDDLPEAARFGIFATPGPLPALVRLSNGAPDVQANTKPDIHGFAIRVLGVSGPAALGGEGDHQDFLLINHDIFDARDSAEFMDVATALVRGGELGVLIFLLRKYGIGDGFARLRRTIGTLAKPFTGYNAERFTTAAPLANGPYAAKLRITPMAPRIRTHKDNARDMASQIAAGPISYEMALQFYTSEAATPIESPRQAWSVEASPPVPVATLTLDSVVEAETVEKLAFDPWGGLAAHRPLGEIMRARRDAYRASQEAREA
jgi:catalase